MFVSSQGKHFPTVKDYKLKSQTTDSINQLVQRVEERFGRLKVNLVIGAKLYKKKLAEITKTLEDGVHFR